MQPFSLVTVYDAVMAKTSSRLTTLREKVGISQRELARQLDVHHSNVSFWERSGNMPPADVLPSLAKILGITVDELLGQPKTRSAPTPGGKLGQLFEQVAKLPRTQQARIAGTIEDMLLATQARQAG
jgi:transcriptional regulator with XRE-family HTH domain